MTLIDSLKSARRVSTPLVAIQTPDPVATIQRIAADVGGDAPKVQWDFCSGLTAVNPQGRRPSPSPVLVRPAVARGDRRRRLPDL